MSDKPAWPGPVVELREDGFGPVVERVNVEAMRRNRLKHVPDDALYYVTADHPGGPGWLLVAEGRSDDDDPEELVWWCRRINNGPGGGA